MQKQDGTHLGKVFVGTFVISALIIFVVYAFTDFEVALLFALVWLYAVAATAAVGIENVLSKELEKLHQYLKGYLLDIYAELIKK